MKDFKFPLLPPLLTAAAFIATVFITMPVASAQEVQKASGPSPALSHERVTEILSAFRADWISNPPVPWMKRLEIQNELVPELGERPGFQGVSLRYGKDRENAWIRIIYNDAALELLGEHGVLALLCHEAGHFFGGSSASEGQADYWAANVCLPRLLRAGNIRRAQSLEFRFLQACHSKRKRFPERWDCAESLYAGFRFLNALRAQADEEDSLACRLKTFAAGASGAPLPECR